MAAGFEIGGAGCLLTVELARREFPGDKTEDGHWVAGSAALDSGAFQGRLAVSSYLPDIAAFRREIAGILGSETLSGDATLSHIESNYGARVRLQSGGGELSVFLREHVGAELSISRVRTDQSYLVQTLAGLDAVLAAFPVAGE